MEKFGKKKIKELLQALDSLLTSETEIIICGGAAGILEHGYDRGTMDIDVLISIPKLSSLKDAIKKVADKYGLNENWLNDSAKRFIDRLPDGYEDRLNKLEDDFKNLRVSILSDIDIYIMKLAAFRPDDISDIKDFQFKPGQIDLVKQAIKKISKYEEDKAFRMKLYLQEKGLWTE